MIKVENLSMLFSTEEVQTKALNEVTFEIGKGTRENFSVSWDLPVVENLPC